MAQIRTIGLKKFKRRMKAAELNMPKARAQTLNNMAFHAFTLIRGPGGTIDSLFQTRNQFTKGSVRFAKASNNPRSVSIVGSMQQYMAVQELGKNVYDVGHIPTKDARISKSQAKVVSRPRKLSNRNFAGAGTKTMGNRAAFIRIKQAQKRGEKGPFRMVIDGKHGRQEGLYILEGRRGAKLRMLHNVTKDKVTIKRRQWLLPPAILARQKGLQFFVRNFQRTLQKG